jgi:predicted nucleic acid-binding protein
MLIIRLQAAERRRKHRNAYLWLQYAAVSFQLAIQSKLAYAQYNQLLQKKYEREERERQERERILAERALLAEQEREELERQDREAEDAERQEKERQRQELEQRRQELELQHKQDKMRENMEKIAEEEKRGLKELGMGLLSELDNLEDLLRKDLPPIDALPDMNVHGVSDFDLLDLMADPSFFGTLDVPRSIVSELDRIAGTEEPVYDLPPPPPPGGDFDFLDKLPPPPDMPGNFVPEFGYELPPPPPGLDSLPPGIIPSIPEPPSTILK